MTWRNLRNLFLRISSDIPLLSWMSAISRLNDLGSEAELANRHLPSPEEVADASIRDLVYFLAAVSVAVSSQ